ncbi:hypothetical protein BDV23DRAFT_186139 [Aspergillus alliaceus]|uniref:FAD/NAD(P)-binding domain-containing protein n=1 Tax=Petromyces alliaceus TaxID=209559 RepID=A0A5N7C0I1_PETAA|nr:hypothetical protein BDV23DRAFT_186139 [Aspergillus alliaceus]
MAPCAAFGYLSLIVNVFTVGLAFASTTYDVAVIGGGPAGLSAVSSLSRVRRNVIMFDSGEYRNDDYEPLHDIIGSDGIMPAELRDKAQKEIKKYGTAAMKNATVKSVISATSKGDLSNNVTSFTIKDDKNETYTARKIVLATGVTDVLPEVVMKIIRSDIYWCPWCSGYESKDLPIGILGDFSDIVGSVLEIETLNTDIIALVNGTETEQQESILRKKYPDWERMLGKYNVEVNNATITNITVDPSSNSSDPVRTFTVEFDKGDPIVRKSFIYNYPTKPISDLPQNIKGLKMDQHGKIITNMTHGMRTSLPGVFAVGDANNDGTTNVPHAMWSAKRAAVAIHIELQLENSLSA